MLKIPMLLSEFMQYKNIKDPLHKLSCNGSLRLSIKDFNKKILKSIAKWTKICYTILDG